MYYKTNDIEVLDKIHKAVRDAHEEHNNTGKPLKEIKFENGVISLVDVIMQDYTLTEDEYEIILSLKDVLHIDKKNHNANLICVHGPTKQIFLTDGKLALCLFNETIPENLCCVTSLNDLYKKIKNKSKNRTIVNTEKQKQALPCVNELIVNRMPELKDSRVTTYYDRNSRISEVIIEDMDKLNKRGEIYKDFLDVILKKIDRSSFKIKAITDRVIRRKVNDERNHDTYLLQIKSSNIVIVLIAIPREL